MLKNLKPMEAFSVWDARILKQTLVYEDVYKSNGK